MKKIPKGLAMLEVMIGVALAVIAIAIFLSMQSGSNDTGKALELGEDVGLLVNKMLAQVADDFATSSSSSIDCSYTFNSASGSGGCSGESIHEHFTVSDAFVLQLQKQGVTQVTAHQFSGEDPDARHW